MLSKNKQTTFCLLETIEHLQTERRYFDGNECDCTKIIVANFTAKGKPSKIIKFS
ncbi:MAG: hypothetical protein M3405_09445 [Acidobacteriota bacterium]|nr:hypothetical protein [Acidobacteriota bacterium]